MNIDFVYALDDSCQVTLFAKGHVKPGDFKAECERFYKSNFEKDLNTIELNVKQTYWRNVKAPADNIVSDRQLVESKAGPGAFPVTILDKMLPM